MKTELDKVWERLKKKGGTLHMSLSIGVVAHVKNEKPTVLVEPVKEWDSKKYGAWPLSGEY